MEMIKIKMSEYHFNKLCDFMDGRRATNYSANWSKGLAKFIAFPDKTPIPKNVPEEEK